MHYTLLAKPFIYLNSKHTQTQTPTHTQTPHTHTHTHYSLVNVSQGPLTLKKPNVIDKFNRRHNHQRKVLRKLLYMKKKKRGNLADCVCLCLCVYDNKNYVLNYLVSTIQMLHYETSHTYIIHFDHVIPPLCHFLSLHGSYKPFTLINIPILLLL